MRQDAWVVVLGRGWSPDVSGRVEAACVLTHVEPAMRQDAWVVVLGRGWSPDVSGRVEAACVLTHVEPAMRQDAWERKREGGGVEPSKKKCASSHFRTISQNCAPTIPCSLSRLFQISLLECRKNVSCHILGHFHKIVPSQFLAFCGFLVKYTCLRAVRKM